LGCGLDFFERNGLKLNMEESDAGEYTFLSCYLAGFRDGVCKEKEKDNQIILKNYIADAVSDIILSHWETILLHDIIRQNYYYFGDDEKKLIYKYAVLHINKKAEGPLKSVYQISRKNKLFQKVMDYLKFNNYIVIDGFIRFRLKEYLGELKEAADKAVDDFLMEREYKEFIQLLKYFVEIQEPQIDIVHVLIRAGSVFKLFDDKMRPIRSDYLGGLFIDLMGNEINYEDLLISALVTIAPKRITFHFKKNQCLPITLEAIKNIFAGKVNECGGCELCIPYLKN